VNVNLSARHHPPGACRRAPDDPVRGRHPGWPRWFIVTASASVLAASLAGCSGGGDDTGGLPEITDVTSPATTPTGPTLTPEQQAVADAVTRYDKVVKEVSDGAPLEEGKLRTVAVEPALTIVGKKLFELKALKNRTVGKSTNRIRSVKIPVRPLRLKTAQTRGGRISFLADRIQPGLLKGRLRPRGLPLSFK
jgi:hypothetical protein